MMPRTSTSVCRPLQYSYAAFKHQSQRTFLRVNELEKSDGLILGFTEKKTIPGIMSLSKKEREYLQEINKDRIYGEYRSAIMVRESKVIFNAFVIRHETLYDCIKYTLDKLFIPLKDSAKSREMFRILTNKKEISLMQNLLCVTFGHKKIPFDIFEKYCLHQGVNPQSYRGGTVTIQAFAEVKILGVAFSLDKKEYANVMFYIINSTNLLRGFDVTESNHFLGQDHADFLIVNSRNNLVEKIYADVKTYTHNGIDKHHVSIFQGNDFDYKQEINNIITSIDRYIAREKVSSAKFRGLSKKLKDIREKPRVSAEARFENLYKELVSIFLNPSYRELRLSLSAAITGEDDVLFEIFFEKSIKPFLEQKKENTSVLADFFPPDSILTEDQHKKLCMISLIICSNRPLH